MKKHHLIVIIITILVLGIFTGTILLKDSGLSDSDSCSSNPNLPPNPGEAGKLTLEGVDSDGDGVRDDVQIAICRRYPEDMNKQNALKQKARAMQNMLISTKDENIDEILKSREISSLSTYCLYNHFSDPTSELGFISDKIINTQERSEIYIDYNQALSGRIFGDPEGTDTPCEF